MALGCVNGGFDEAVAALTAYRRKACLRPHADNRNCPVIFNDYMNCLDGRSDDREGMAVDRCGGRRPGANIS